jgi:hypothetical protein
MYHLVTQSPTHSTGERTVGATLLGHMEYSAGFASPLVSNIGVIDLVLILAGQDVHVQHDEATNYVIFVLCLMWSVTMKGYSRSARGHMRSLYMLTCILPYALLLYMK